MGRSWAITNPERFRAYQKAWRAANRERINGQQRSPSSRAVKNKWRHENWPTVRQKNKEYRDRIKAEVHAHYGNKCTCCDERNTKFLTLDHINNDGHIDRKNGLRGWKLYHSIIKRGFPSDLQLLCWNCNCGKAHNGGICPHVSQNISSTTNDGALLRRVVGASD